MPDDWLLDRVAAASEAQQSLLLEAVSCLRDLLGELIDLQPPDTQHRIADLQIRLLKAEKSYHAPALTAPDPQVPTDPPQFHGDSPYGR
jgi:hypothetical protein